MFGFGKKKLTTELLQQISIEVQMFQSWTLEKRNIDLSFGELKLVCERIFSREKINFSDEHVTFLVNAALSQNDFSTLKMLRNKSGFDNQVAGFCRSINLPENYYAVRN